MKRLLLLLLTTLFMLNNVFSQDKLDTLFFVNGNIEAVQITGLTEKSVQYNYYGEGIAISTLKSKLTKIKTRSGRVVIFENTSRKKSVFSAEDWEKVEVTGIESEVEGLIRISNVSGKAKGMTTYSSLGKLQDRALTKMKMQAAFYGCDVVYMLNQSNEESQYGGQYGSSKLPSSTVSGTAYSIKTVDLKNVQKGNYVLDRVYRLRPNDYELINVDITTKKIMINMKSFTKDDNFYSIPFKGIKRVDNIFLINASSNELVFLAIDRSKQSKIKYYNLYFILEN